MRHPITTEERNAYDSDLAEAFELFVQQHQYLEVLNLHDPRIEDRYETALIGSLSTFDVGLLHNASCYFAHDGREYAFDRLEKEGKIKVEYFRYDTLQDATEHVAELLKQVVTTI